MKYCITLYDVTSQYKSMGKVYCYKLELYDDNRLVYLITSLDNEIKKIPSSRLNERDIIYKNSLTTYKHFLDNFNTVLFPKNIIEEFIDNKFTYELNKVLFGYDYQIIYKSSKFYLINVITQEEIEIQRDKLEETVMELI